MNAIKVSTMLVCLSMLPVAGNSAEVCDPATVVSSKLDEMIEQRMTDRLDQETDLRIMTVAAGNAIADSNELCRTCRGNRSGRGSYLPPL